MTAAADPAPTFGPSARLSRARHRLLVLYVLATAPLVILLGIGAWLDRASALEHARSQVQALAATGAQQQRDVIAEARNLLQALALVPQVTSMGSQCHATLLGIDESNPRISNISVFRPDGSSACNSRNGGPAANVADRAYFQEALGAPPGRTVLSGLHSSRVTGRPTMVVALPLHVPGGPVSGVLTVALDLDWLQALAIGPSGAPGTEIAIIDSRAGTVLARSEGQTIAAVSEHADPHLLESLRHASAGAFMATEGSRLVGYAALEGSGSPLVLTVGLSTSDVLASSRYHLTMTVLALVTAAAAAIMLAWLAAARALLRPIGRLVGTAASIGAGDLAARVGPLPGAVHELWLLGREFDAMAERLRLRDDRIAAMGARIAQSEEHHRLLADNSGDMIARFDEAFSRTYLSPASLEILGRAPDELVGLQLMDVVVPEDRVLVRAELLRPLMEGAETARCAYRCSHRNGQIVWIETFGRRLSDGSGFVTVARDVSIQKALEAQLEAANQMLRVQVMTDALTGISNRRRFDEMLGFEFRRAQRLQEPLSLLMIDIDHFKAFNDSFGHTAGDECLRAVATALDRALRRPGDLVGRYGGEEFAVLLPGTPEAGVLMVAERLRAAVARIPMNGRAAAGRRLTISVGCATLTPPFGTSDTAVLMETADSALYAAKRAGRDRVTIHAIPTIAAAATEKVECAG